MMTTLSSVSTLGSETDGRIERIALKLEARLSDSELLELGSRLSFTCRSRPTCAQLLLTSNHHPDTESPSVRGMDVEHANYFTQPGPAWMRLLFGTPLYTAQIENHPRLNRDLVEMLAQERATTNSSLAAKSLTGNGWRTDDFFLQRRSPPIRELRQSLLAHVQSMVRYNQPSDFEPKLSLRGWAVSLEGGGSMREHVHSMSTYSGVYYVSVPTQMRGGCLRLSDPRPGAQMATLGMEDAQFMESRLLCPEPGLLVLFPSWMPHSVTPIENAHEPGTSIEPRVAIAFNVLTSTR